MLRSSFCLVRRNIHSRLKAYHEFLSSTNQTQTCYLVSLWYAVYHTVVSPNKGTLKIPRTEISFSDHSRQIWTIFGSFRGLVLWTSFWYKIFKFYSKWATNWLILLKIDLFSQDSWPNKGNLNIPLFVKFLDFDANKGNIPVFVFPYLDSPL